MIHGRVLVIAGSDSGGGAGIQADIKTITCLGGYAMTAITALTAQNTLGVQGIMPVAPSFVRRQIDSVWGDIGVDAVKIGMLGDIDVIDAVAEALLHWNPNRQVPVVLDPVMVAKGGDALLAASARQVLADKLLPLADLVTPNLPEAETLTGLVCLDLTARQEAAAALMARGAGAVLMKGGHDQGRALVDILVTKDKILRYEAVRQDTPHTHGTGCSMASAIAAGLAQKLTLDQAVERAHNFIAMAISHAPGFGRGHGPLAHDPLWGRTKAEYAA